MNTKAIIAALQQERRRLDNAIAALEALDSVPSTNAASAKKQSKSSVKAAAKGKRRMSAAGRARIAAAARARWAKVKDRKLGK